MGVDGRCVGGVSVGVHGGCVWMVGVLVGGGWVGGVKWNTMRS